MNGDQGLSAWPLLACAIPTVLLGGWALWDATRPPKCRLPVVLAFLVSLAGLVQWTAFLLVRAFGFWSLHQFDEAIVPYRLLAFSPLGSWGIWFTAHWFARRSVRQQNVTPRDRPPTPREGPGSGGGRLGD